MGAIRGILVLHFTSDSPFILVIDWYILRLLWQLEHGEHVTGIHMPASVRVNELDIIK